MLELTFHQNELESDYSTSDHLNMNFCKEEKCLTIFTGQGVNILNVSSNYEKYVQ